MFQKTFRVAALCALIATIFILPQTVMALGSPDMTIQKIDASALKCDGTCGGGVEVEVGNLGRALQGGYNIFVELKVYEQGQGQRAKTYKEKLFNFPEGSKTVTFGNVRIQRCGRPYVFEAKVYVVGGNFREGNTRNNELKTTSYVRAECSKASGPAGGGNGGSNGTSNGAGTSSAGGTSNGSRGTTRPSTGGSNRGTGASPDLLIQNIDPQVTCGSRCKGDVDVEVRNAGRALQGGYNVFIELKVYEQGQGQRAQTYKEKLFNFPGESSQSVTFKNVKIERCNRPFVFEAKVYVVGGNFREGNTRNNDKTITQRVSRSCG